MNHRSLRRLPSTWQQPVWVAAIALAALLIPVSSSGTWLLLLPASVVVCFFGGRRLHTLWSGVAGMAAGAFAAGIFLWLSDRLSLLGFAFNLLAVLLLFVFLPWFIGHSRRAAAEHARTQREQLVAQAGLRERARIAAQMHDRLGHDLALLALQASALQVSLPDQSPAAAQTDGVRRHADAAIAALHEVVGVLRESGRAAALQPAPRDYREVVARARARGMDIALTVHAGWPEDSMPTWCSLALHQLVREALTNAARHAPGTAVAVDLAARRSELDIRIENVLPDEPAPPRAGASGLASLRTLFAEHGGHLAVLH